MVLGGCPRCPDNHDLSKCPSFKFNSLNFDSKKISVITPWDHLKTANVRKFYLCELIAWMGTVSFELERGSFSKRKTPPRAWQAAIKFINILYTQHISKEILPIG